MMVIFMELRLCRELYSRLLASAPLKPIPSLHPAIPTSESLITEEQARDPVAATCHQPISTPSTMANPTEHDLKVLTIEELQKIAANMMDKQTRDYYNEVGPFY